MDDTRLLQATELNRALQETFDELLEENLPTNEIYEWLSVGSMLSKVINRAIRQARLR